jgi:hypothetical protein
LAPFFACVTTHTAFLHRIVSEGLQPLYILKASFAIVLGIASLWIGYFSKTNSYHKRMHRVRTAEVTNLNWTGRVLIFIMLILAVQSQVQYGGSPWTSVADWQMSSDDAGYGYFTGDVTGYNINLYRLVIPISVYLFFVGRKTLASLLLSLFIYLRLFSVWSRHSVLMMLLALCLCFLLTSHAKMGKSLAAIFMVIAIFIALFLQARGHTSIDDTNLSYVLEDMSAGRSASIFAGPENQIFFVSTAFMQMDDDQGYNLGSKLLRETFVRPLPRRFMPEVKAALEGVLDFRILGIHLLGSYLPSTTNSYPGFIGSLYSLGSWIGVIAGTFFVGTLVRLVQILIEDSGNVGKMIATICMSMFPLLFRFDIESIPFYLGLQLLPLLLLIHFSKRRKNPSHNLNANPRRVSHKSFLSDSQPSIPFAV